LFLGLGTGSFADRQHRDHRKHAEHDTQHRQPRAQLVQQQALEGQANRADQIREGHGSYRKSCAKPQAAYLLAWSCEKSPSPAISPSFMMICRRASRATEFSCVTIMIVRPSRFRSLRSCMISFSVEESRFPVGSSARMIDGS